MKKIGPLQVLDEIGKGGMATVYRALQPSVNRVVALKVFPSNLETDEALVKRFKQEAETAANLIHDNIIKVWDASVNKPPYYIAMEFLEGGSLAERLVNGLLEVEEAVAITGRLCDALDYAHSRGVIHRDLKPENVLFSANNKPVLTDFGIAKAVENNNLTVAGAKFGTPEYMSPEQAKGLEIDYRTDLYSLAAVLYEMLTGRPPFRNDEPLVTMRQIIEDPVPSLRDFNPDITAEVEAVIIRALAKNPGERYQSGLELNQALLNALNAEEVAAAGSFEPSMEKAEKKDYSIVISRAAKRLFSEPEARRKLLLLSLLLIVLIAGGIVIHYIIVDSGNTGNTRTTIYDRKPNSYPISGLVADDSGQGVEDDTVTYTGKNETNSAVIGDEGKAGWSFSPASAKVTGTSGNNFFGSNNGSDSTPTPTLLYGSFLPEESKDPYITPTSIPTESKTRAY